MRWLLNFLRIFAEIILAPIFLLAAFICRFIKKKIDIGLGPEPLINNVYHKRSLNLYGYTAETFVTHVYFITNYFDIRGDTLFRNFWWFPIIRTLLTYLYLFILSLTKYKCLYIYFNGGILGLITLQLWRLEPLFFKLAGVKIVVMPYGGDVQDMSRSPNLLFKDAMARDYPMHRHRRQSIMTKIDLWTRYADHIIAGCEWVDYMYYWDTLMLAHFSIDVDAWKSNDNFQTVYSDHASRLRILHAPNHRYIKGTQYFLDAVAQLKEEGLDIEIITIEGMPNEKLLQEIAAVDVVADQLVVGWYAMFAIEAMAFGKPVMCYLRKDLEDFYVAAGLVSVDEIPIINCTPLTVKAIIRDLALNKNKLLELGERSREYVVKHHSLEAIGKIFDAINNSIGLNGESD